MGVWIETKIVPFFDSVRFVTPYVGVWIETSIKSTSLGSKLSHPTWVCGLKPDIRLQCQFHTVTPYVGVWIETGNVSDINDAKLSHPTWVCGLKHRRTSFPLRPHGHTLRGCVD